MRCPSHDPHRRRRSDPDFHARWSRSERFIAIVCIMESCSAGGMALCPALSLPLKVTPCIAPRYKGPHDFAFFAASRVPRTMTMSVPRCAKSTRPVGTATMAKANLHRLRARSPLHGPQNGRHASRRQPAELVPDDIPFQSLATAQSGRRCLRKACACWQSCTMKLAHRRP